MQTVDNKNIVGSITLCKELRNKTTHGIQLSYNHNSIIIKDYIQIIESFKISPEQFLSSFIQNIQPYMVYNSTGKSKVSIQLGFYIWMDIKISNTGKLIIKLREQQYSTLEEQCSFIDSLNTQYNNIKNTCPVIIQSELRNSVHYYVQEHFTKHEVYSSDYTMIDKDTALVKYDDIIFYTRQHKDNLVEGILSQGKKPRRYVRYIDQCNYRDQLFALVNKLDNEKYVNLRASIVDSVQYMMSGVILSQALDIKHDVISKVKNKDTNTLCIILNDITDKWNTIYEEHIKSIEQEVLGE